MSDLRSGPVGDGGLSTTPIRHGSHRLVPLEPWHIVLSLGHNERPMSYPFPPPPPPPRP